MQRQGKANYTDALGRMYRREYALLSAQDSDTLSKQAQRRLDDGWKQWGPPFCNPNSDAAGHCLYQGIVKETEIQDE